MEPGGFSFITVVTNIAKEAKGISELLAAVAYVGGIFCVVMAFLLAKKAANPAARGEVQTMGWFWSLVVGAMLFALPTTIASVAASMFGAQSATDLTFAYRHNPSGPALAPLVPFLKLIGVTAVIRGLFVLRAVGMYGGGPRSPATFSRGITLVIAGVLAVHMKELLGVLTGVTGLNLGVGLF